MDHVELQHASWSTPGAERLQLFDANGERLFHVIEANAAEGWRIEIVTDARGVPMKTADGKGWATRRVLGPVRIVQLQQSADETMLARNRAAAKRARQAARQAKGMRQ